MQATGWRSAVRLAVLLHLGVPAPATAQELTVELTEYRFRPDRIGVVAGKPVALTLVNTDSFTPHNLTLTHEPTGLDVSVDVGPGDSVTVNFTAQTPGSYPFYCDKKLLFFKSHRERGMTGTLIVHGAGG